MRFGVIAAISFLVAAVAVEAVLLIQSRSEVNEFREEVRRLEDALAEARASQIPEIDKPDTYFNQTVALIEKTLYDMAREQQRLKEIAGYFESSYEDLDVAIPSNLEVIQMIPEETAFCIEIGSRSVPGAKRRFISVTGEIDRGTCQTGRPLSHQVGADPAAHGGGHMKYSDVRLRDDGIPRGHKQLGRQWTLVFDAAWQGPGLPVGQQCKTQVFDVNGEELDSHAWGFRVYDRKLEDYVGASFFEKSELGGKAPARFEFDCSNEF